MDRDRFIWCRHCDAVHHVTPFDKAPVYRRCGEEVEELAANDWQDFMRRHAGHRLEPLEAVGERRFLHGAPWDPMTAGYVEVSDGRQRLLLRQSRASIQEPLRYELVSGRLMDRGIRLAVQEEAIREEIKRRFSWAPAAVPDDSKIETFIGLFAELVAELDPAAIEVGGYSQDDDNVTYGVLPRATVEKLLDRCALHFSPAELAAVRRFTLSHLDGCDVMAVVMRRELELERAAG
ncbi:MAG TPA: hypothetical protein VNN77_19875 [candidate division Zixibacteria bacterium]|nr:hypothetical protein [candidate division Zixibacteria bacterium]